MNKYKNTLKEFITVIVLFSIIKLYSYNVGFENTLYTIAALIIVSIWNVSDKNKL